MRGKISPAEETAEEPGKALANIRAGEKGEERWGLGGKPPHECLRGNCGRESLRGIIAQKYQRLGGSVW